MRILEPETETEEEEHARTEEAIALSLVPDPVPDPVSPKVELKPETAPSIPPTPPTGTVTIIKEPSTAVVPRSEIVTPRTLHHHLSRAHAKEISKREATYAADILKDRQREEERAREQTKRLAEFGEELRGKRVKLTPKSVVEPLDIGPFKLSKGTIGWFKDRGKRTLRTASQCDAKTKRFSRCPGSK